MHHANIILSDQDCREYIFDILVRDLSFNVNANPDFLLVENQSFGIDDARNLERWAIGRPLVGETKVYLIITKSITHEAQNALLKVLEEPPVGTYIFINLENVGGLLPTFISRVMFLEISSEKDDIKNKFEKNSGSRFLNSKIKDRLAMIRSLVKKEDKSNLKELIKDLEIVAFKENRQADQMKNILTAKIFASARGSSPKMLLEWLSGVL